MKLAGAAGVLVAVGFAAGLLTNAGPSTALAEGSIFTEKRPEARRPYIDPGINQAFVKLARDSLPGVVSISTSAVTRGGMGGMLPFDLFGLPPGGPRGRGGAPRRQEGMGSGFVVSADGYILTNNHVVEDADEIVVHLSDEREFKAKIVGRDPRSDVALLKVTPDKPLPVLALGDSDKLQVGEWVVAMGNPLGLDFTVTSGIVSQLGRRDVQPNGRQIYANFIQTDASINPGNSGGPLFNIYGEVIGINTAIAQGAGIGFAIPINMVKDILPSLMREGRVRRSWLGVQIQPVTADLAQSLGLPAAAGALVAGVVDGSPAATGGIQPEDVIVSFEGKPIRKSEELPWLAGTAGVGKNVTLELLRNGKKMSVRVTLGELPGQEGVRKGPPGAEDAPADGGAATMGLRVRPMSPAERAQWRISEPGVVVVGIADDAPAARSGVEPGDVILRVNKRPVDSPEALAQALDLTGGRGVVRLLVYKPMLDQRLIVTFPAGR